MWHVGAYTSIDRHVHIHMDIYLSLALINIGLTIQNTIFYCAHNTTEFQKCSNASFTNDKKENINMSPK